MASGAFEEGSGRAGARGPVGGPSLPGFGGDADGVDARPAAGDVVRPLTRDRVAQALTDLGYPLIRDAEGDLGLLWAQAVFHIYLLGEGGAVLQVRTAWHRRLAIERLGEVLETVDRWNREFVGPKCYVRVLDDGRLSVVAEASTPLTSGASDNQLRALLSRGVGQGMRVIHDLEALYPDPAGQPPEEVL